MPWYTDPNWVGVISQIFIGVAGLIIAYFQYQISITQKALSRSIVELKGEIRSATENIGALSVEIKKSQV